VSHGQLCDDAAAPARHRTRAVNAIVKRESIRQQWCLLVYRGYYAANVADFDGNRLEFVQPA